MENLKQQLIYIPVEGVGNENDAHVLEEKLKKIKGVASQRVEINNHRAVITPANGHSIFPEAVEIIRKMGYEVPSVKDTFPVLHLNCASCAASAQSMTISQNGVINASVNFATATLAVEYLPGVITPEEMKEAVQEVGYDLVIEKTPDTQTSLDELRDNKYRKLQKRTAGAIILSLPVVIIGMFFMNIPYANEIMWILSTPVILIFGRDFYINAWKQAKHKSANMDTLVALSTGVAYAFSVFNTLFPQFWQSRGLEAHVYFEAAAVIIAFILLGRLLEEKAKGNTSEAIKKLMGLQPKMVTRLLPDGTQQQIPAEEIHKEDIIVVKPGEKIAVDGEVTAHSSYVDESMLTGEPVPVLKQEGEKVYAGTINQKGSFLFKAEKVGSETMLAQIIKMVQDAQGSKAPVQKLVDKIAGIFVPVVISIAIVTFFTWMILGGDNGFSQGLLSLITVLVIACPCALGLATPTAIMVGVGKGAENGILIKDAESLELAKNINAVVLDKTGTITEGKPVVTDVFWLQENNGNKNILYTIEKKSEHPLADAVVNYYNQQSEVSSSNFESITGKGAAAEVDGIRYFTGNKKLLREHQILISEDLELKADDWSRESKTVIWFADDKQALAVIAIADKIKTSSAEAIKKLMNSGIEVYMLTGDNETTASAIAAQTGITNYKAEVLPAGKAEYVKELQAKGKIVAMVGDGINDSTALAQADVSIAMGKGSDIAMDVAKMTIISSDLQKIPQAVRLSKQTVRTIRQNLFWAFIYNLIGIPIAAGILYPINGFMLNPMIAGAAMAMSSVSVVTNSLRLKWKK
ncbi:MAG TPA: heavy metal translocating P-type ATPase [Mariniphaga sp.]|nr:heavy metal translocating P-type ATPase [Mariniphaga sp.]